VTKRLPIQLATVFELMTVDEVQRYPTLDHWLTRELSREHAAALSSEAKRHRRLAQVRLCRARAKHERALASLYVAIPTTARDVLDLRPRLL
jgi:hypothetical protein